MGRKKKVTTILKESNTDWDENFKKLGQHWKAVGESRLLLFRVRFL